jgi:SAM-dependent methyltransferase
VEEGKRLWYKAMIEDKAREKAYRTALAREAPGKVVVDVGAGLGHLSLYALEAGASHVVAIERDAEAIEEAEKLLRHYAGQVEFVHCSSLDWRTAPPLNGFADVVVSETFDSTGVGEGALRTLVDARRFLREGGVMIPSGITLHMTLLGEPLDAPANKVVTIDVGEGKWFDWTPKKAVLVRPEKTMKLFGIGFAFTLHMGAGQELSTLPGRGETHWRQGGVALLGPAEVKEGETLSFVAQLSEEDGFNPSVRFELGRVT